jgi:hypothetical protein
MLLSVVPVHQDAVFVEAVHDPGRHVELDVVRLLLPSQLFEYSKHLHCELLEQVFELRLFLQSDRMVGVADVLLP